jgi:hypothetical protein
VRELADTDRIARFMKALGEAAREETHAHLVGGATAVLYGWRATTIDVDLKLVPESDSLLRAIPQIKESLQLNVELASPPDFIPVPDGWEDRGAYVRREGRVSFFHFDIYAQALAKVERGHARDVEDLDAMVEYGLVEPARVRDYFARVEPQLYRFPALDPASFRRAVEERFGG